MADMQKFDQAVDQVILDSERLHTVVNGDGLTSAIAEDGSPLPSIRKAMLDNIYFKTPLIAWVQGTLVREYNQLYLFTDTTGRGSWWYAPTATQSNAVQMGASPLNDPAWRVFADSSSMSDLYAPITSPIFKGNPQANTPAKGDDTQSLATTEFVTGAVADLKAEIEQPSPTNTFENLTVTDQTLLNKLRVTGEILVESPTLIARSTAASFNTLDLYGVGAHLTFSQNGSNPGASKTDIGPWKIVTHELVVDTIKATAGEFGDASSTTPGLVVHGQANMDYLHLTGNAGTSPSVPKLVVDGITQLNNLIITGTVTGLSVSVDGLDIRPKSVVATEGVTAADIQVNDSLTVIGQTTLGDLNVTGTVTGISLSVDGEDINPKSVSTTNDITVGGKLTVGGDTSVNNLTINGTVTGLVLPPANVDGMVISPSGVNVPTVLNAQEQVLDTDGVTVLSPAVLQALIPMTANGIQNTGSITTTSATVTDLRSQHIRMPVLTANVSGATTISNQYNIQNLTLTGNTQFTAPSPTAGFGESYFLYLIQDATGGRVPTFGAEFVALNDAVANSAPNSITLVQIIYRGTGTLFDLVVTPRP